MSNDSIFSSRPGLSADAEKRDVVVNAFKHAWSAYEHDAMGADEYLPVSHSGANFSGYGGIGYTIVEAIDTMILMGLDSEYAEAKNWIKEHLSFDRNSYFSTFETTIRVLSGLLSAYYLTGDELYKQHAADIGDRILPAFDTASGLPESSVNLGAGTAMHLKKVMEVMNKARSLDGLAPIAISYVLFFNTVPLLMSGGNSYYEYLLKQYIQTNRTEPVYLQMYSDAMRGVHDLIYKTPRDHLTYVAELLPPELSGLGKFSGSATKARAPWMLPGRTVSVPPRMEELTAVGKCNWETGVALLETFMETHKTATGLSPESVNFLTTKDPPGKRDWYIKNASPKSPSYNARYMLRPKISESVFLAWRLTGDIRYRKYAWEIFSAIELHCLAEGRYATGADVDNLPVRNVDKQETFFLSETLKYLFLTFAEENVLNLSEMVFNAKAHPLPIFNPSITK
ncbi:alpha-1,2-Mannosidase [Mycena sanguinolenta]|uniref:alpha-1,2-Mannosidase n=1 Tax=Mycena sanguinolenta TaxID=230812 RepID=A0A8H7D669_9AGAR|nr:alpha-1,2-Mannosidase [Mycena sanguinolenta]